MHDKYAQVVEQLKVSLECDPDIGINECTRSFTGEEIIDKDPSPMTASIWKPTSDEDFFAVDVDNEAYKLAQRWVRQANVYIL